MTDAFDADVVIYAADSSNPLGASVARRLAHLERHAERGIGSKLLIPEVLGKPIRENALREIDALSELLVRLDLRDVDSRTAVLAAEFVANYRLKTVDATHLATAVVSGCDRFITNNSKDFAGKKIDEIEIVFPYEL